MPSAQQEVFTGVPAGHGIRDPPLRGHAGMSMFFVRDRDRQPPQSLG
jgi:hypothetical protein